MQKTGKWTWVLRPFAAGVAAGAITLLIPLFVVGQSEAEELPQLLPVNPAVTDEPQPIETASWDEEQTVRILLESGEVEEQTMAEYLWRVVAAEMPAAFEEEALRAQAVCARTYTLWKMEAGIHGEADLCGDSACCQAYTTHEEVQERWGDLTEAYTRRIAGVVKDTDGMILTYEGKPIQAVFFSSSTASTEDAAQVWGSGLPYLVSVESPEREEVPNYRSTVILTAEEMQKAVKNSGLGITLSGDPATWIGEISYTASGRVSELKVGNSRISGGAARSLFGLRSACFEVNEKGGVFTFSVTGYGHGVGMSQYGANAMAKDGSSWEEIVRHYYTGITVEEM